MHRVTIAQTALRTINYTDKKGAAQQLLVQNAYLFTVDPDGVIAQYPDKFEIVLPKGQTAPYPAGDYTLHPSAIYVDRNGKLACEPRLTPAVKPAPARG